MTTYQKQQAQIRSYRATDVNTATRLKLLVMLYEGAIRFVRRAEAAILDKDLATKGEMIGKASAIVAELRSTLDHSQAPELAANLERLYEFVGDRLVRANIRNDVILLHDAIRVLETLHSAWVELSQKPASELVVPTGDSAQTGENRANAVAENNYVRISV